MVEKDKLADTEWLLHKAEQFNVEAQKRKDKAHATYQAKKAKIKRKDEQEAAASGKGSSADGPVGDASGKGPSGTPFKGSSAEARLAQRAEFERKAVFDRRVREEDLDQAGDAATAEEFEMGEE